MKICYISNLYYPFVLGGAETYVKNIAEEFVNVGEDVVIITTNPKWSNKVEYINNVKIYRVFISNIYNLYNYSNKQALTRFIWHIVDLWNLHAYFLIRKILEKENPDVVHVHNFKGFSVSIFKAIKYLNLPFVFTAHDYYLVCPKTNLLGRNNTVCNNLSHYCKIHIRIHKDNLVKNNPDLITAPSQFIINKLKEYGFFENTKAMRLPLGIKLSKRKIEKNYDLIDILYVGNLSKHKGVHILIQAFKELEHKNIRLHIVGKGVDVENFRKLAGDDIRIKFYGFVSEEKLKKLYEMANIVVIPSIWYENSPVVIYESFMSGTPVIGSRIGGIPELVRDGYNGLLFEAGNVDQLKEVLESLIVDEYTLKKLEYGAKESIKKYDISKHTKLLIDMYNNLR